MTGNMNDAKSIVTRLRYFAAEFKFKQGYHIPIQVLAQKLSEWSQQMTQYIGYRTMCVVTTIVGIDEVNGPQVFKIDPAGFCMGYSAIACGQKDQEAINQLEKLQKKTEGNYTKDQAIQKAIETLQTVIGTDFKSNEVEVGIASVDKPRFMKLTTQEIDSHLNAIADDN